MPVHLSSPSTSASSLSSAGFTFQILTWPSLPPVARRWYDRPQDGAHATEVIAYGVGASPSPDGPVPELVSDGFRAPEGAGSSVNNVVGRREGDTCIIWGGSTRSDYNRVVSSKLLTLTVPVTPQPAARTSPQYLSLHHDTHQPPSASRLPNPGLCCNGICDCCSAWATRDAEAPSSVAFVCVGVANATDSDEGEDIDGSVVTSTSSQSCQVANEDCSRHSYIRRWLSDETVA